MQTHAAKKLYCFEYDCFICPICKENLETVLISSQQTEQHAKVQCRNCKDPLLIKLPKLHKKLIYVDQWFVSNLFDKNQEEVFQGIVDKLEELMHLQKVFVIASFIHAEETAKISKSDKQKRVWEKFSILCHGHFANDDVFAKQYADLISHGKEQLTWQDILLQNPHAWDLPVTISSGFKAYLHPTGQSLLNVTRALQLDTNEQNNALRDILNRQCEEIDHNSTPEDCYSYLMKNWREELLSGIDFYEQINAVETSPTLKSIDSSAFYTTIDSIVILLGKELPKKIILLKLKQHLGSAISTKLSLLLEAQHIYKAIQTLKKGNQITQNKKKFSRQYGVSRQKDISHISTFLPYADVFLTDNEARKQLCNPPIKECIEEFNCEIFSNNNIKKFINYLDNLLNEAEMENVKLTRRLLVGLSSKENNTQWEKIMNEIIKKIIEKAQNTPK